MQCWALAWKINCQKLFKWHLQAFMLIKPAGVVRPMENADPKESPMNVLCFQLVGEGFIPLQNKLRCKQHFAEKKCWGRTGEVGRDNVTSKSLMLLESND